MHNKKRLPRKQVDYDAIFKHRKQFIPNNTYSIKFSLSIKCTRRHILVMFFIPSAASIDKVKYSTEFQ